MTCPPHMPVSIPLVVAVVAGVLVGMAAAMDPSSPSAILRRRNITPSYPAGTCERGVYLRFCPFCEEEAMACADTSTPSSWQTDSYGYSVPPNVTNMCWRVEKVSTCSPGSRCGSWEDSLGWMLPFKRCATIEGSNTTDSGTRPQNVPSTDRQGPNLNDTVIQNLLRWSGPAANASNSTAGNSTASIEDLINANLLASKINRTIDVASIMEPREPLEPREAIRLKFEWFNNRSESQLGIQYTTEDGQTKGTPNGVIVETGAIRDGWWTDEFSCCTDYDLNNIRSPEIIWDAGSPEVGSFVLMVDDIEDDKILWLMINIDPREHRVRNGASGECPWWQLVWPWWFGHCQRYRLPGSGFEMPNRDWHWRFRGICAPEHQVHRIRVRVFAQKEWDQHYLKLRWPDYSPDDVAYQLHQQGETLGVASMIANGARREECGGAARRPPESPPSGIVADFDFTRKTLENLVAEKPPIIDLGTYCSDSNLRALFRGAEVRGEWKDVLDVRSGTGLAFNASGLVPVGKNTTYTVVMDINMERTSCFVRLLNVNPPQPFGWYFCDNLFLFLDSRTGPYLAPNTWHHIVFSTREDQYSQVFINGVLWRHWYIRDQTWQLGVMRPPPMENQVQTHSMIFFNDCGLVCRCAGGGGQQSAALVHRIQIYNRMLSEAEVSTVYKMHTTKKIGL